MPISRSRLIRSLTDIVLAALWIAGLTLMVSLLPPVVVEALPPTLRQAIAIAKDTRQLMTDIVLGSETQSHDPDGE
jgi:hypothetical protein